MVDHKDIAFSRYVWFRVHLERLSLFVVLYLKIFAAVVDCVGEFEVEVFNQMGREGVSQQLDSMELIKLGRLLGKGLNGVVWDWNQSPALLLHLLILYLRANPKEYRCILLCERKKPSKVQKQSRSKAERRNISYFCNNWSSYYRSISATLLKTAKNRYDFWKLDNKWLVWICNWWGLAIYGIKAKAFPDLRVQKRQEKERQSYE